MPAIRLGSGMILPVILSLLTPTTAAQYLKISIPRRSVVTPVQRLNSEGVGAVLKHNYEKAEGLFYKAYLYDPADPFTLNNLGYVSELHGQLDRAEKFYKLADQQGCDAIIARSDAQQLTGKPMMYALGNSKNAPMRVNRMNVLGIELLSQERGLEAESLLKETLAIDPQNAFTLNNLGVAAESIGDPENALKYYDQAAATRAQEQVVVTPKRSWRGQPVSDMAASNAKTLRKRLKGRSPAEVRAAMLAFQGVNATNRNDWSAARQDFLEALPLTPHSAFALNNRGYVAERDGDLETAKLFYGAARNAEDAGARVGSATENSAQGQPIDAVAGESYDMVDTELKAFLGKRRQQNAPVQLKRRDDPLQKPLPPPVPVSPSPAESPSSAPPPDPPKP